MTVRRLFSALLALALLTMALRATVDPDMWWHLRTGELIVQEGIPREDVFSFTVAGTKWITHEWLSQVFMWLVYRLGGLPALILTFAGIAAGSFWLVYRTSDGLPYVAGFVTLLAAVAASVVWGARPQMFNLLLTAVTVMVVESWRQRRWPMWTLWLMVPIVALWANLHSGYLFGVALLGVYAVGEAVQRWLFRADQAATGAEIRMLAVATGGSFLAAALTPNGPQLWIYPFETLGSNAMQALIQEWHSPNFHIPVFWAFGGMLALGLIGFVLSRRPVTLTEVLLFLGTGAAGLQSARNIPLFALVAVPILARHWTSVVARDPRFVQLVLPESGASAGRRGRTLNALLMLLAVAAAALWAGEKIRANEGEIRAIYPVEAIDFIETAGLQDARTFNSYGWGGYMIWRGLPVFVDGRADVYGDAFLFDYVQTADMTPSWRQPLETYGVDLVLVEADAPLSVMLSEVPGWREAYADEVARIFVREVVSP